MKNFDNEVWKDIPNYEGLYQVSNLGRVRSLDRVVFCENGQMQQHKGRILYLGAQDKGYYSVHLCKNRKVKSFRVNRLVWITFNGLIPEGMEVNHINEVKSDNRLCNLNLMSRKENVNWGTGAKRSAYTRSKTVLQYDLNGNFIKEWDSAADAEKEFSTGYGGNITRCCKKERTMAYNYLWKYKDDKTPIIKLMVNYANSPKCNEVDRIDKNGNVLEHFNTAAEAERKRNVTRGRISAVCNSIKQSKAGGYYWQWSYPLKRELVKYKRESEGEETL